jgi:hypothetical protein
MAATVGKQQHAHGSGAGQQQQTGDLAAAAAVRARQLSSGLQRLTVKGRQGGNVSAGSRRRG